MAVRDLAYDPFLPPILVPIDATGSQGFLAVSEAVELDRLPAIDPVRDDGPVVGSFIEKAILRGPHMRPDRHERSDTFAI
jgi:hypothetical protein